jgi:hypothetical protein
VGTWRTIRSPRDLEGAWFVVVDEDGGAEVEHFDTAEFARVRGRRTSADGSHLDREVIEVDGRHRFRVGDTIELASGAALEDGFRRTVRDLWRRLPTITAAVAVIGALEVSGLPWRTDIVRLLVVYAVCAVPAVLLVRAAWWRATRAVDGRVTRAMAGRLREQFDRQRSGV